MSDDLRHRFLRALRRERDGYVPLNISLCPPQLRRFEQEYGHRDVARQWGLAHRTTGLPFHASAADFTPWLGAVGERTRVDEWGIGHQAAADGSHFTRLVHPLAAATSVRQVERYPLPEPATASEAATMADQVRTLQAEGFAVMAAVAPVGGTVFWPAYKLRGMEQLLVDLLVEPALAEALISRVTTVCEAQARLVGSARPDVLHLADDLGTQLSTYVSPEAFRRWFKPGLARVIAAARQQHPDILVHFHSDGAVQDFIPDLIDIGVDILNPVQPECMDPEVVKRQYGERLSLSGCVGTQTTMPFGTAAEVEAVVRRSCRRLGRGGGLWLAPTHVVEPEVPWENVLAFIHTASEFG